MSYGITPALSRVLWWERKFGSNVKHKDDAQFMKSNARERASYLPLLEDMDKRSGEDVKMIEVYDDFFNGSISHPEHIYLYWYLVENMMHSTHAGDIPSLDNHEWYPASSDPFWTMNSCRMYNLGSVSLPSPDDFPVLFTVFHEDLPAFKTEVEAADLSAEQIAQAVGWVDTALAHAIPFDLFLFYY